MADELMPIEAAVDFAAAYVSKQVLPFQRIHEVLLVAKGAEHRAREAEARKGAAEAAVIQAQDKLRAVTIEEQNAFNLFKATNDAQRHKLADDLAEANRRHALRLTEIEATESAALRESQARIQQAEADAEARVKAAAAKTAKAEKALELATAAHAEFKRKVGLA